MKLTETQIKFIDHYLKNSGVEYLDIRYEMTDHVATALEEKDGDFYDEFKAYMAANKSELLRSAKNFSRTARNRVIRILYTNLIKPQFFIIFTVIFGSAFLLRKLGFEDGMWAGLTITYYLICVLIGGSFMRRNFILRKKTWSAVNQLHGVFTLLLYIIVTVIKVHEMIENVLLLFAYYSFVISFTTATFLSYMKLKKYYKVQFNG